jgi:hypothetical protein
MDRSRMTDLDTLISPRALATAAILFFAPVVVTFAVAPGVWWADYLAILFHLSVFLLVARLPAPEWARAAGYGWLILDVVASVLTLNHVPPPIGEHVRLGGHIFAGIWMVAVSLPGSALFRIVGVIAGAWLALFTFGSPVLPRVLLAPDAIACLIWYGLIAWQNGSGSARSVLAQASP